MRTAILCCTLLTCLSARYVDAAERNVVNGLNAEFFNDRFLSQLATMSIVPNIDDHWSGGSPVDGVRADDFSVRWTGWIKAPAKGQYEFAIEGDDGFRLWIDDHLVIDGWHGGHHRKAAAIEMNGAPQKIKVEFFEIDLWAWITLRWRRVGGGGFAIVPSEVLFPDEANANAKPIKRVTIKNGLTAEYFDVNFKKRFVTDYVHRTEAIWADEQPFPGVPHDAAARYSGFLVPKKSGKYRFVGFGDDSLKVLLNGKPLMETTFQKGPATSFIDLEGGKAYPLVIDFVDYGGWGSYLLHWVPPGSEADVPIPADCLFPTKQALPKDALK